MSETMEDNFVVIIGIALVVEELHKGPRLAFRYPSSIPSNILNDNEELVQFHEEYLGMSPEHFAKFFRPKTSFCNELVELTLHHIHHICYSCSLIDTMSKRHDHDHEEAESSKLSMFNMIISSVRNDVLEQLLDKGEYMRYRESKTAIEDPISLALGLGYRFIDDSLIKR
jgi:hypothetical protein